MILKELTTEQLMQLLQELENSEKSLTVESDTLLRKYMDTLNPSIALIQAPIDIWKEASDRWRNILNSITWIQGSGVGVIKK